MILLSHATEPEHILFQHIHDYIGIPQLSTAVTVTLAKTDHDLTVSKEGSHAQISYADLRMLARGFCLLKEQLNCDFELKETPRFSDLTFMLDCSRNAVPTLPLLKGYVIRLAAMGFSSLQLYTEDTFEVQDYPYFGYMRGRYTCEELKELDQFCQEAGIRLVPCIQTLAHLSGALRWSCFHDFTDIGDILLAGSEKTYDFIEAMIASCARSFSSRSIHIGMDEAHLVGLGKYLKQHGYEEPNTIICRHMERVLEICRKHGFRPMIWSDMFFRLASRDGLYYSEDSHIPDWVIDMVPKDISLVYWDYYTQKKSKYDQMIEKHQCFCNPIIFAGGAWKWRGFAPSNGFSLKIAKMALESCAEHHIDHVILTAWGDNGGEASHLSILPVLQYYSEFCFGHDPDEDWLSRRFLACTGEDLQDFMLLDLPNQPPCVLDNGRDNPSKYLLYQDVLCPLFDRHTQESYEEFYARTAEKLHQAGKRSPHFAYLYDTLSSLCLLLSKKARLGVKIQHAYLTHDTVRLSQLSQTDLLQTLRLAESFHEIAARQWQLENKPFGWEILDIRLGAVETRLKSAASRIAAYQNGSIPKLEELEEPRLFYDCRPENVRKDIGTDPGYWHDMVSAGKMLL